MKQDEVLDFIDWTMSAENMQQFDYKNIVKEFGLTSLIKLSSRMPESDITRRIMMSINLESSSQALEI